MVSFRPFRPCVSAGPKGFGSPSLGKAHHPPQTPLVLFGATSAVFPPRAASESSAVDSPADFRSSSLEFPQPFSISGLKRPFFRSFRSVRSVSPHASKVPPSGFGYPLGGVSRFDPWKPLSASNARGLRPSKPFSFPAIRRFFRIAASVPALSSKTFRPWTGASTGCSRGESRSLVSPGGLDRGRDDALLGFQALSGFRAFRTDPESISLSGFPFRSYVPAPSRSRVR